MRWRGIILTGTSGTGKSTISELLRKHDASFEQVKAVTTRDSREGDEPGAYQHLTEEEFEHLGGSLVIWAGYRNRRYGIKREHLTDVENRGKTPVLVITSKSLAEYLQRPRDTGAAPFLKVFVDATDDVLDARLGLRGDSERLPAVVAQREEDRQYRGICDHVLQNIDLDRSLGQVLEWWRQGDWASSQHDTTA